MGNVTTKKLNATTDARLKQQAKLQEEMKKHVTDLAKAFKKNEFKTVYKISCELKDKSEAMVNSQQNK